MSDATPVSEYQKGFDACKEIALQILETREKLIQNAEKNLPPEDKDEATSLAATAWQLEICRREIEKLSNTLQPALSSSIMDLYYELDGVLADVKHGGFEAFNSVCVNTITRVQHAIYDLAATQRVGDKDVWKAAMAELMFDYGSACRSQAWAELLPIKEKMNTLVDSLFTPDAPDAALKGDNPILTLGAIEIPKLVRELCETIKDQNNKVNTPVKFQKHRLYEELHNELKSDIAWLLDQPVDKVDYVYFSCANGAEEHIDQLDKELFTSRTVILPVILPSGVTILNANGSSIILKVGTAYEINHELPHSLTVGGDEGCVVIMASVLL